jgi:hypothetical protein
VGRHRRRGGDAPPERLIGGDPDAFFDFHVRAGMGLGRSGPTIPPPLMKTYREAIDDPGAVEAMCENYRAGAAIDRDLDDADLAAGRQIECPVLCSGVPTEGCPRSTTTCSTSGRAGQPTSSGKRSMPGTSWLKSDRPRRPPLSPPSWARKRCPWVAHTLVDFSHRTTRRPHTRLQRGNAALMRDAGDGRRRDASRKRQRKRTIRVEPEGPSSRTEGPQVRLKGRSPRRASH